MATYSFDINTKHDLITVTHRIRNVQVRIFVKGPSVQVSEQDFDFVNKRFVNSAYSEFFLIDIPGIVNCVAEKFNRHASFTGNGTTQYYLNGWALKKTASALYKRVTEAVDYVTYNSNRWDHSWFKITQQALYSTTKSIPSGFIEESIYDDYDYIGDIQSFTGACYASHHSPIRSGNFIDNILGRYTHPFTVLARHFPRGIRIDLYSVLKEMPFNQSFTSKKQREASRLKVYLMLAFYDHGLFYDLSDDYVLQIQEMSNQDVLNFVKALKREYYEGDVPGFSNRVLEPIIKDVTYGIDKYKPRKNDIIWCIETLRIINYLAHRGYKNNKGRNVFYQLPEISGIISLSNPDVGVPSYVRENIRIYTTFEAIGVDGVGEYYAEISPYGKFISNFYAPGAEKLLSDIENELYLELERRGEI